MRVNTDTAVSLAGQETGSRSCAYCSQPFIPKSDEQQYCKPNHRIKAKHKRNHGISPAPAPLLTPVCPWCGCWFETQDPAQRFCRQEHKQHAITCERKEEFLTGEAAAAAASRLTVPVLRGVIGFYECPRPGVTPHWHLFSEDKRALKRAR